MLILGGLSLEEWVELWRTMPWSWLVSVAPAGCGVVSIFWARWREPYRESVEVHWKRASSPSKKSNCRVRSGLELYTGGKKEKSHVLHQFSFPEFCCSLVVLRLQWFKKSLHSSEVVFFMWNIHFNLATFPPKYASAMISLQFLLCHLSAMILIMWLPPANVFVFRVIPIPTVTFVTGSWVW